MGQKRIPITIAEGDGIGPEIMQAVLHILSAARAPLEITKVEIGEKVYQKGEKTGISPDTWDIIRNTKAFLKAPITTPQGGGFKSLNVTVRTTLGLYANVRPCVSYFPFVQTKHPHMDVVIVRENEEDLYTGIEYRQTSDTYQALKITTRPGCEKIIRYAFEYALANKRKKVSCFTKDNILKLTDGLFHKIFEEIAQEYPSLENEHWIIDIGSAKLADTPEAFDVIVMPNLYGDILSDVAAQIAGSVGLAGSANIGEHAAMFEAIHGSAPRRAGKNMANPSGLLMGAILMLVHVGLPDVATLVHNAWLATLEQGVHTYDIFADNVSKQLVGTKEFAEAVAQRLGEKPELLKKVSYTAFNPLPVQKHEPKQTRLHKTTHGIDIFVDSCQKIEELEKKLVKIQDPDFKLSLISNRGAGVWPTKMPETACSDSWRCRYIAAQKGSSLSHHQIARLLQKFADAEIDFVKTEHLCSFDGSPGYTLAQEEQ
ncbi:NADP-dependent isocitrate dehydrogenase [Parachlamydia sp. AcF125]|uniref:NADP-dependent isocitrate dehydrogenase n=1 Tax=Parachlamydia sp. AcF125 TaxID=2795736 RepID=UPI001BC8DCEE|nr:NADP-dependent isocitrate dehydrogenase [Parachlamydia sp. AcF125]MBS4167854.1 Isocitrate dehydrogenase [NADP] [Parachlamydia sp. AcF125]